MISSVEQPHVKLSGDYEGPYVVEEARSDGRLLVAPDTSAQAIMDRLGHQPWMPYLPVTRMRGTAPAFPAA